MSEIYTSIVDLPLDKWNGVDVEDIGRQRDEHAEGTYEQAVANKLTVVHPTTHNYVPFVRTVKLGTVGRDVLAIKRALSKAGYGKWGQWGTRITWFGPNRVKLLKQFQKDHHLHVDGVYGLATHKALAPYFDQQGIWLLHHTSILSSGDAKRKLIVASAMLGYANRYSIHYTQSPARMQGVRNHIMPPHFPIWEDCSSFSTWCYWTAKAPDPNGLGYNGEGYTGTIWNHGTHATLTTAKPGDLVLYGWRDYIPTHVAVYVGFGRVVSHGSEPGPLLLNAAYRTITGIRSFI